MLTERELTGRERTHVVQRDDLKAALHPEAIEPFLAMKADAAREGIDIEIVSGFRDYEAQRRIWNLKYRGERPLYDADGNVIEFATLDEPARIDAILCWSALPGASRHHWGSEIDVIDRAAAGADYRVQLLPEETAADGVFGALHRWLDRNMARFGFFRPYRRYRGGVQPEPWHLSYAAVSTPALQALTLEVIERSVRDGDLLGFDLVMERLDEIYDRFVRNVDGPERVAER